MKIKLAELLDRHRVPIFSVSVAATVAQLFVGQLSGLAQTVEAAAKPTPEPLTQFCYVTNQNDNSISEYTLDSATGALVQIKGSPFRKGLENGYSPAGVLVPSTGKFAYVVNENNGGTVTVSGFSINPKTGALSAVPGSPFKLSGGQYGVAGAVDPSGRFLYVAVNMIPPYNYGGVFGFVINPTNGALTAVPGSPFPTAQLATAGWLTVDPSDRFVYVTNLSYDLSSDSISGFSIDPTTGALTEMAGSPFATGSGAAYVAVDPNDAFAYVTNIFANAVSGYTIDPGSGALTEMADSPFPTGSQPYDVEIDPTGSFAYVANSGDNTVSGYSINSQTGALTAITGSPFPTLGGVTVIAIDPTGAFAYTPNFSNSTVSGFAIDPDTGVLTPVKGSPFPAGAGAVDIAFTPPVASGFDFSALYLTKPHRNLSSDEWQTLVNTGYTYAIVAAWGGHSSNPRGFPTLVHDLIAGAHGAGLTIGAYCLLNFVDEWKQSGPVQVQMALDAVGADQVPYLAFVAIDVERGDPNWPADISTNDRIARIADAVEAVRLKGLQPIMYTSMTGWDAITSATPNRLNTGSVEISGIPLWDLRDDGHPTLAFAGFSIYDHPYGTWTARLGKQYKTNQEIIVSNGGQNLLFYLAQAKSNKVNVDLDIFDPMAFSLPSVAYGSAPALTILPSLTRNGEYIDLAGSISNFGNADALATRLTGTTLNGIPAEFTFAKRTINISAETPYRANTIPAGSSVQLDLKFPAAKLQSGTQGTLEIDATYGGSTTQNGSIGPVSYVFSVTIP
jgi:6-phosphogluconolactonase